MPSDSARFRHVPQTEQEVVCLFVALLDDLDCFDRPIVIETVKEGFPDCTITAGGKPIRIEFELYGSRFNHAYDGCDMLVCWRDDRKMRPPGFPVLELADIVNAKRRDLFHSLEENVGPWNYATFFADAERKEISVENLRLTRLIMELAEEYRLGPLSRAKPTASVAVGKPNYFKVHSNGHIGFCPLSRLGVGEAIVELVGRLNRVVPTFGLNAAEINTKKKGGLLSDHFQSDEKLREFFEVWHWFSSLADG